MRRIKGRLDFFRDDLDRGQDRHARLRYTQGVRQIDRVLDNVPLVRQRGVNVDRGVGDEERPRVVGRVDRKDVAYAPGGSQAAFAVDNSMHELIRMERTLHQRLDLAGAGHGDGLSRRGLAVLCRNDLVRRQIELSQRGGGANLGLRPNQNRRNEIDAGGFHGAKQRWRVDRVDNRGTDWIEAVGHLEQEFIASPLLPQLDFGENHAGSRDLLGRRDDIRSAGDDLLRFLIHGPAIENDPVRLLRSCPSPSP